MNIIGINHGEINSSAALFKDNKIVAGACEERFNRQKKTRAFPMKALDFCLNWAELGLSDCDCIAQAWNPGAGMESFHPLISGMRSKREDYFYSVPDNLFEFVERKSQDWVQMSFPDNIDLPPIYYLLHHRSHAANAFFLSPFDESAIMTCDWRGEFETTTLGLGKGCNINVSEKLKFPQSLGMFYGTFTEILGYRPDNDEWKVMALSAFDVNFQEIYEKIRGTVKLLDNGFFELDQSYYKGATFDQKHFYTKKLVDLLGGRVGKPFEEPDEWHFSIASAMQKVSEEIALNALNRLHKLTGSKNLAVSGGFFMNSVFNGKIIDETPFENLYVSYAPTDAGNSIGAALYTAHCIKQIPREITHSSSYLGPEFENPEIEEALNRRKIKFKILTNPEKEIAEFISRGEIVAVNNGRMEFGERALGNRSILADPRQSEMKDKINSMIKYREGYRPFAPAVIHEKAHLFFDVKEGFECTYMEKVVPVREDYRNKLPAVTHVDGSGRVQTINKKQNRFFYNILSEFEKISGFPILLNTSFNINGEPIVLTPDDALNTFFNSGLEFLAIGQYLVTK